MKKFIISAIAIALVLTLGVTLAACNNATPQGQLENPLGFDHNAESFVYDVLNTYNGEMGTYKVHIQGYEEGATVPSFGNAELSSVAEGILVTGELGIGDDMSKTGCYFKLVGSSTSYMVPVASYSIHISGGNEVFRLQATYDAGSYNYERTVDGKQDSGKLKVSGTCFDNNEFHQMLRTVSTYSSGLSLAYTMPLVTQSEALAVTITATTSSSQKVITPFTQTLMKEDGATPLYEEGMDCYVVKINRSTKVVGASQTLYYAVANVPSDIAHPTVRTMKHILLKIVEPYKVGDKATVTVTENNVQVEKPIQMEYTLRNAYID